MIVDTPRAQYIRAGVIKPGLPPLRGRLCYMLCNSPGTVWLGTQADIDSANEDGYHAVEITPATAVRLMSTPQPVGNGQTGFWSLYDNDYPEVWRNGN